MVESCLWDFDFTVEYSDNALWKSPISKFHYHNVYEIYYLLENEIISSIDDRIYHLKPGSLIVVPPNVIHTTNSINEKTRKRILIYLPENYIKDFLDTEEDLLSAFPKEPILFTGKKKKSIEEILFKLLNEYEKDASSVVMLKSLLGQFLVSIKRAALGIYSANDSMSVESDTKSPITKMIRYISNHFEEDISLNSLSEQFFLNPTYISRAFKEQLGVSFSEYLKNVRIRAAVSLLKNTNLDMTTIATRTGFTNSTTLCRSFKSSLGITPLKYRKSKKK